MACQGCIRRSWKIRQVFSGQENEYESFGSFGPNVSITNWVTAMPMDVKHPDISG